MTEIQEWARRYRDRGLAVCRIKPLGKDCHVPGWQLRSAEPDDFRERDNIGLVGGPPSQNLVCVDLDNADALERADSFLPPTDMVDGRPGKPRSHRWYRLKDVPAHRRPKSGPYQDRDCPGTRHFGKVMDIKAAGSQAVVPASVWSNGERTERREWSSFGTPPLIDCERLYRAAEGLASACGWAKRIQQGRPPRPARQNHAPAVEYDVPPIVTDDEAVFQARAYLAHLGPAVAGQGGRPHTWSVIMCMVADFGLTPEQALPLLLEWNRSCRPPRTPAELEDMLASADELATGPRGWRVRPVRKPITVHIMDDGSRVFVGLGTAGRGSYVDMASLHCGFRWVGRRRVLAPALESVVWAGRDVLLCPASTITTNARETWDEFFLARLLREHGAADVIGIRIESPNGRRAILADTPDWREVRPPTTLEQARKAAYNAGRRANELDRWRKSLPRRKPSRTLEQAIAFLQTQNITVVTKDVVERARREGIGRSTLYTAISKQYPPIS